MMLEYETFIEAIEVVCSMLSDLNNYNNDVVAVVDHF